MEESFHIVGHRPQYLHAAVSRYATGDLGTTAGSSSLRGLAEDERETHWDAYRIQWSGLGDLQQAVLRRMIMEGDRFKPFDGDSIGVYADALGRKVTTGEVQRALDDLRELSLVVRLERGRYSLDDPSFGDWLTTRQ